MHRSQGCYGEHVELTVDDIWQIIDVARLHIGQFFIWSCVVPTTSLCNSDVIHAPSMSPASPVYLTHLPWTVTGHLPLTLTVTMWVCGVVLPMMSQLNDQPKLTLSVPITICLIQTLTLRLTTPWTVPPHHTVIPPTLHLHNSHSIQYETIQANFAQYPMAVKLPLNWSREFETLNRECPEN